MHTIDQIKDVLKIKLKRHRYSHSVKVLETAMDLAKAHNVSEQDAAWASILHDYAKNLDDAEMLNHIEKYAIDTDLVIQSRINLAHGLVGAEMAKCDFNIENEDILNAIRNHTFGRAGMSDLEKLIYLADFIEPDRRFSGVHKIREVAYENLDKAMLMALEQTIGHILGSKRLLHPDTVHARNYFVDLTE